MSTAHNDGGPAFPAPAAQWKDSDCVAFGHNNGMSLRDWFAGKALTGIMARPARRVFTLKDYTADAYDLADAMLKAREAKP